MCKRQVAAANHGQVDLQFSSGYAVFTAQYKAGLRVEQSSGDICMLL